MDVDRRFFYVQVYVKFVPHHSLSQPNKDHKNHCVHDAAAFAFGLRLLLLLELLDYGIF